MGTLAFFSVGASLSETVHETGGFMKVHLMRSGGKKGKREFKRDADGQIKSGRGVMRGGEEERGGMRLKQRCMNSTEIREIVWHKR